MSLAYLVWKRWSPPQSQLWAEYLGSPASGWDSFQWTVPAEVDSSHKEEAQVAVNSCPVHRRTEHTSRRDTGRQNLHQRWAPASGWKVPSHAGTRGGQGQDSKEPLVANCRPGRSGSRTGPCPLENWPAWWGDNQSPSWQSSTSWTPGESWWSCHRPGLFGHRSPLRSLERGKTRQMTHNHILMGINSPKVKSLMWPGQGSNPQPTSL